MSTYHTVEQGEHLSGIAMQYGFTDYRPIWDHPENSALKKERKNPNVLFPGDRLFVPDKLFNEVPASAEKLHRFELAKSALKLRLVLEHAYEKPIADAPCQLKLARKTVELTTNGQGRIEQSIAATDAHASLLIKNAQTPLSEVTIEIEIGHLDPVDKLSGQQARLMNLGYFTGPIAAAEPGETADPVFRSAVEEFQCEHGLTVDGKCGPVTQAKLKEVHGS